MGFFDKKPKKDSGLFGNKYEPDENTGGQSLCVLNTESHGSITVSEGEIDTAIRITIDMYLFVTATNITELEMAVHYPKEEESASTISIEEAENKNESAYMAAES